MKIQNLLVLPLLKEQKIANIYDMLNKHLTNKKSCVMMIKNLSK